MLGRRGCRRAAAVAAAVLALAGCGSLDAGEVEQVGADFAGGDPADRCALLAPATLASFEHDEAQPCDEAIEAVPVGGGEVTSVEVWGQEAQVRLSDDTLFLTRTAEGWRVSAAACTPRGSELPYDCEVAS